MDEKQLRNIMIERGLSVVGDELSFEDKCRNMRQTLYVIIPPRSIADRTTLRNVVENYAKIANDKGQPPDSVFKMLIDFALEASGPFSRVPAAVFISILKKEWNYLGKSQSDK